MVMCLPYCRTILPHTFFRRQHFHYSLNTTRNLPRLHRTNALSLILTAMPLTLRPSVQTSRLYGQHAYSVLFVDIALVLTCIPIFFCGIVNIMQILRDDVTLLTHEGSEYRSSVLKCLATFLDTIPSSTTAFYALCSITCWTLFTLYPAIALCVDVALIGLWITIVILQIRGFDYFILENRYSLGWTTRPDADNWQGTYKLFRHNTNTVAVFQRLIIVGGFIVLLL